MNNPVVKVIDTLKTQRQLLMPSLVVLFLLPSNNAPAPISIPQEDFFYPDEPDFLPKVLVEREPRARWTPQDAAPFWKDPAGEDRGIWRNRIETVIDELLEGVP